MPITNINWPEKLPQQLMIDGFNESPASALIRTEMDAAIAKQRPRFSTTSDTRSGRMLMSLAQFAIFKEFFRDTLKNGSLEFNMPIVGDNETTEVVRFTDRLYGAEALGVKWMVELNLETIP